MPSDFLKHASRRVLDLAGAGELREAIFVRLVMRESIPIVRRQSLQLTSLRRSCRSQAIEGNVKYAVSLVVAGPQVSYDHRLLARSAWDEVSRGRPITISLIDEALVTAAQELYQKATAAVEGLGRRLDAARGLQAGTGEAFLLEHCWHQGCSAGFLIDADDGWALERYDRHRPQVPRGSAASPLGFWDG